MLFVSKKKFSYPGDKIRILQRTYNLSKCQRIGITFFFPACFVYFLNAVFSVCLGASHVRVAAPVVSLWEERCDFPTSAPAMRAARSHPCLRSPGRDPISAFPNPPRSGSRFFFLLELMQRFPLFKIYSRPSADQRKRHLLHPGSKSGPYTRNFVTRQSPMFFIYLIYLFSYMPKSPSARATRTSRRAAETERLRRVRIKLFNVQSRNHTLLSVLQKDFCSVISPLARNYGVHVLRVSMELRVAPLTVF